MWPELQPSPWAVPTGGSFPILPGLLEEPEPSAATQAERGGLTSLDMGCQPRGAWASCPPPSPRLFVKMRTRCPEACGALAAPSLNDQEVGIRVSFTDEDTASYMLHGSQGPQLVHGEAKAWLHLPTQPGHLPANPPISFWLKQNRRRRAQRRCTPASSSATTLPDSWRHLPSPASLQLSAHEEEARKP